MTAWLVTDWVWPKINYLSCIPRMHLSTDAITFYHFLTICGGSHDWCTLFEPWPRTFCWMCSWARHLVTVLSQVQCLSPPRGTSKFTIHDAGGQPCDGLASHPGGGGGGVEVSLVTLCHRNREKLQPVGPFGNCTAVCRSTLPSFTFPLNGYVITMGS